MAYIRQYRVAVMSMDFNPAHGGGRQPGGREIPRPARIRSSHIVAWRRDYGGGYGNPIIWWGNSCMQAVGEGIRATVSSSCTRCSTPQGLVVVCWLSHIVT